MSNYDRRMTYRWQLRTTEASAWELFKNGVIHSGTWTGDRDAVVIIDLKFEAHARALFVSRPSERVIAGDVVVFLPMEADHTPDGYEPMLMEWAVNDASIAYDKLEAVLHVCGPADRVADIRTFAAEIESRKGSDGMEVMR